MWVKAFFIGVQLLGISATIMWGGLMASSHESSQIIQVPQDYGTIQEAINAATAGSTIVVNSGIYQENLTVRKPVHLQAFPFAILEGDPQEPAIFIENAGPVTVTNFLIRRQWQELARDIKVTPNRPLASSPELYAGVPVGPLGIRGQEAVREAKGIVAQGTTQVFLEGNRLTDWATSIRIASGASAVLANNTIETDAAAEHISGIVVEGAEAKVIGNRLHISSFLEFVSGIYIMNSQVQIKENEIRISEGSREGAEGLLLAHTKGAISANWIIVKRAAGIVIHGSQGLTLRSNMIAVMTPSSGIVVYDYDSEESLKNGFVRIQENTLMGVLQEGSIGISVLNNRATKIRGNIITNFWVGVSITREAHGHLQGNLLVGNQDGVVIRRDAVKAFLYENRIWNNRGCGIRIEKTLPQGEKFQCIEGQENWIVDSGQADLCPADYPWPPGFRK
jgi:nitrous oxidase accessory protein NosD